MTETPAETQYAPSPSSGGGATSNPAYVYRCERCGDHVPMTGRQYDQLLAHQRRTSGRPLRLGAIVHCDSCATTPRPAPAPAPLDRHPLDGVKTERKLEPRHLPPAGSTLNLKPSERQDYGVTVTIQHSTTHTLATLVGTGPVYDALADVVERIDEMNDDLTAPDRWYVVTISTPGTIYTDLQGHRDHQQSRPEPQYLGQLGRHDLLAP